MRNRILTLTLILTFASAAWAKFYPAASVGPAGDSTGEATRTKIAKAIEKTDALLAILDADSVESWPESWRSFYGSLAAFEAAGAVREVRTALRAYRAGWDQMSVQTVTLKKGWNAFYLYASDPTPAAAVIRPSEYAKRLSARVSRNFADAGAAGVVELLADIELVAQALVDVRKALVASYYSKSAYDWPIEDLYSYVGSTDAAAQFETDSSAEAEASNPFQTWSAAAPDSLNLVRLQAGRICTAFASETKTVALLGTGVKSGSMSWHKTGGSDNPAEWNYLGLAITTSRTTPANVLCDLDFTCTGIAKLGGTDETKPNFVVNTSSDPLSVADGETLIANASAASSWYAAPVAYPRDGIVIAASASESSFQLKNTTAAAQTVTGVLQRTGILATAFQGVTGVAVQSSAANGWKAWNFSGGQVATNLYFVDTLAAGETRTYAVRFPRAAYDALARANAYQNGFNRTFSAMMRFNFGGSSACTYLGLKAASDSGAVVTPWPMGLWIGTLTFDKVSQVKGNQTIVHNVPAGGRMSVRGLVYVDAQGVTRLLHHALVRTSSVTNAAGDLVTQTTVYAGDAKPASGDAGTVMRVDSIAMDIDHPVIEGEGSFTNTVSFSWKIAPNGRANPFYHPYHPEHDGLDAYFEKPAPSGDDMNNYREGKIKPETWSIENVLSFASAQVDLDGAPDTMTGTCTWELGNVRRKVNAENIRTSGTFVFKRVTVTGKLVVE